MKPGSVKKASKTARKPSRNRDGSKTALVLDLLKARRRCHARGTDEGDRLAGTLGPGLPVRYGGQEDGPGGHVDQG
jgi:hypothetical protein